MPFDSGSLWKIHSISSPTCEVLYWHNNVTVMGDTTINGITYKKMIAGGYSVDSIYCMGQPSVTYYYFSNKQYFLLRNDTLGKKVYGYFSGVDALVYDFSLLPGDTIKSALNSLPVNLIVDSVSSLLLGDGQYHKHIWFSPDNMGYTCWYVLPAALIEGVGSVYGLVESLSCFESGSRLNCFSYSGNMVYTNANFSQPCVNTTSINETVGNKNISVFPNPFLKEISIAHSQQHKGLIENAIYSVKNILGKCVFRTIQNNANAAFHTQQLDLSFLSDGIYFLEILTAEEIAIAKIIKR